MTRTHEIPSADTEREAHAKEQERTVYHNALSMGFSPEEAGIIARRIYRCLTTPIASVSFRVKT